MVSQSGEDPERATTPIHKSPKRLCPGKAPLYCAKPGSNPGAWGRWLRSPKEGINPLRLPCPFWFFGSPALWSPWCRPLEEGAGEIDMGLNGRWEIRELLCYYSDCCFLCLSFYTLAMLWILSWWNMYVLLWWTSALQLLLSVLSILYHVMSWPYELKSTISFVSTPQFGKRVASF